MPTPVFVSYDHDDRDQVNGFQALIKNSNHPMEFTDYSLKEAVKDISGNPIIYAPSNPLSKPVRDEILRRFNKCSKLIILIGKTTYASEWVNWEINEFYKMKKEISGENTSKRIQGMKLNGNNDAKIPQALVGQSPLVMLWDPQALYLWINQNPNK